MNPGPYLSGTCPRGFSRRHTAPHFPLFPCVEVRMSDFGVQKSSSATLAPAVIWRLFGYDKLAVMKKVYQRSDTRNLQETYPASRVMYRNRPRMCLVGRPPDSSPTGPWATRLAVDICLSILHETSTQEIRSARFIARRRKKAHPAAETHHSRGETWAPTSILKPRHRLGRKAWKLPPSSCFALPLPCLCRSLRHRPCTSSPVWLLSSPRRYVLVLFGPCRALFPVSCVALGNFPI